MLKSSFEWPIYSFQLTTFPQLATIRTCQMFLKCPNGQLNCVTHLGDV